MKRFLYLLLSVTALCATTGCSDDDGISSGDVVHKSGTVFFIADESSQVVPLRNIQSDDFTAWRPDADSWLTLEHLEGRQLIVRVTENLGKVRTSKITVRSGNQVEEIPVYQMEKRSVRFDGIDEVKLRGVGETQTVPLLVSNMEAPYSVEVEGDAQSWVTAEIVDESNTNPNPTPEPEPNEPTPTPDEPTTTSATRSSSLVDGQTKPLLRVTMQENIPGAGERIANLTIKGYSTSGSVVSYKISVKQAATYRKSYSFSIPEFTDGVKIYKVMAEDGTQIAEIAKEWLGDENNAAAGIDMQAAVVYLMGENGKADLSDGYIAQVYMINTGENNYTYRAPDFNEEIYGGRIVWNKEENCIQTYTKGTLTASPEKLYVPGDNYPLTIDEQPNTAEATLQPYVVEDNRPNDTPRTYRVVKVGTQYWFDHNLMARTFLDGTKIQEPANGSQAALEPVMFCIWRKADDSGYAYTSNPWKEDCQAEIESMLQKFGGCYNYNCLNKLYVPDGQTIKDYWAPFYDLCYNGYFYDMPVEENQLCPEGWMPPTESEISLYQSYVQDKTVYTEWGYENNKYTRHRRVRDMSLWPDSSLSAKGDMGENITGFCEVLTPRLHSGSYNYPSGNNLTYTYMLSRTIMPFISGNGSNGALNEEAPGIVCFTGQNGVFSNRWFGMSAVFPIRCKRVD